MAQLLAVGSTLNLNLGKTDKTICGY